MEQRREHKLTPYMTVDGAWVHDTLGWSGHCSACGEQMFLTAGIDRSAVSLLSSNSARCVESSYDQHPCKAQPYRVKRRLGPMDMAHPIIDAHFIPDAADDLYAIVMRP